MTKGNAIVDIFQEHGTRFITHFSGRIKCQKMKKCSTLAVYNDTHHHIPSVVMFQNERINKLRRSMHPRKSRSCEREMLSERKG